MNSAQTYLGLLGKYATQYAGVKGFSSTVDTLRDLHLDRQIEAIDQFMEEVESYRRLCIELHDLAKTPLDPRYQRIAQEEQAIANEVASHFSKFHKALSDAINKLGKGFRAIEKKKKYLTQNRTAAVDMIRFLKSLDKQLATKKSMYDKKSIQIVLQEIKRSSGDVQPVIKQH